MKTSLLLSIALVATVASSPAASAETLPQLFKSGAIPNSNQEVIDDMTGQLLKQNQDSLVLQSALDLAEKYRGKGFEAASAVMVVKNPAFDPVSLQPEALADVGDLAELRLKPYLPVTYFIGRMLGDPIPRVLVTFFNAGQIVLVGRLNKLDATGPGTFDRSLVVRITVTFTSPGGRSVPFDSLRYKLESATVEEHDSTITPESGTFTAG